MDCSRIKELLSEYIDGALDTPTRKSVEEHLSVCRSCQEELTSLRTLVGELRSLEPVKAPEDFLEGVHDRISPTPGPERLLRRLFLPLRIKIPLELAAAATVATLVILVFNMQRDAVVSEYEISRKGSSEKRVETPSELLSAPPQAPVAADSGEALKEEGPIELVLLIDKEIPGRSYPKEGRVRMKLPQKETPKDHGASSKSEVLREQEPALGWKPAQSEEIQKIRSLIIRMEGRIIKEDFDNVSGRLTSIFASLPAGRLHLLYREIGQLATLKESTPITDLEKDQRVRLRIRLTYKN